MSRPIPAFLLAAALLAAAPGALRAADAEAKKAHDQAVQTALDEFRNSFKGGDDDRVAAVKKLERVKDARIIALLAQVLADPSPAVSIEATKVLAEYEKSEPASQALAAALNASTNRQEEFKIACLKALGKIRDWGAAPVVKKHFHEGEQPVCRAAVTAAGDLRCPDLVGELIDLLRDTGRGAGRRGGAAGGAGRPRLRAEAEQALEEITGEKQQKTAEGWEDWWKLYGGRVTEKLQKEDREDREKAAKQAAAGG